MAEIWVVISIQPICAGLSPEILYDITNNSARLTNMYSSFSVEEKLV